VLEVLKVSNNAADRIRGLVEHGNVPADAGLRIANDITAGSLKLTVAAAPEDVDLVVEASGARLFLDPTAAQLLADKTLDVETSPQDRLQFAITAQTGTSQ
jgi:Fe-S cluster assembly iron-binding protein IscA